MNVALMGGAPAPAPRPATLSERASADTSASPSEINHSRDGGRPWTVIRVPRSIVVSLSRPAANSRSGHPSPAKMASEPRRSARTLSG
jgi:hypothetical protein